MVTRRCPASALIVSCSLNASTFFSEACFVVAAFSATTARSPVGRSSLASYHAQYRATSLNLPCTIMHATQMTDIQRIARSCDWFGEGHKSTSLFSLLRAVLRRTEEGVPVNTHRFNASFQTTEAGDGFNKVIFLHCKSFNATSVLAFLTCRGTFIPWLLRRFPSAQRS